MNNSEYKPLLLTTTIRNPERFKDFLIILSQFNEQILTNDLIEKLCLILISKGLYQPTRVSPVIKDKWKNNIDLSEVEASEIYNNNPQKHKEKGFDKGWPSRFDTWFKLAKELGLIWYEYGKEISFSEAGNMLIDIKNPQNERLIFANAYSKYQRNNPYRKVLNKNIPLILLIKVIQILKENSAGISKEEIPFLLCWQNDNADQLAQYILSLRKKYGYSISHEIILEECHKLLNKTKRDNDSLLGDYPDEFIRKMRLTGLVTVRGGGRFIDINTKELSAIQYILLNYGQIKDFQNEKEYFDYMASLDKILINILKASASQNQITQKDLDKWKNYYDWKQIKDELLFLSDNLASQDNILKIIEGPLRLEFLTTLAIMKKIPNIEVFPNFISDDEGLPTSCASGGKPDIICYEQKNTILIEVTLLKGTQQHIRESFSIHRHLEEYQKNTKDVFAIFISPKTYIDTLRYFKSIKNEYDLEVRASEILKFVNVLEISSSLNKATEV